MTKDISQHGACLEGVQCWEQPGEVIGVRHGSERARFRVVWVGRRGGPQAGQIGVYCVEQGKFIWGVALSSAGDSTAPAASAPRPGLRGPLGLAPAFSGSNNRRKEVRYRASGGVKVQEVGSQVSQWATLHDISVGGCYVETTTPLLPTARAHVLIHSGDFQIQAKAAVSVTHRLVGMGLKFTEVSSLNRERLQRLVEGLAAAHADT